MRVSNLKNVSWECVHFINSNPIGSIRKELQDSDFHIFMLENKSIKNDEELFKAISAAIQLPSYFGNNWDALDECLIDFDWMPKSKGYIFLIQNSKILWKNAASSFGRLIQSWLYAAEVWSKDNIPFHLIFTEMD